jgi:hypothetical protein
MKWGGYEECIAERGIHRELQRKSLVKSRHRWEYNIKGDFREAECENVNCIHLAQERPQKRVFVDSDKFAGSTKAGNFLTSRAIIDCCRNTVHRSVSLLLIHD